MYRVYKRIKENKDEDLVIKMAGFNYNDIKVERNFCYHVTTEARYEKIKSEGLIPNLPSPSEVKAVYLAEIIDMLPSLARILYQYNKSKGNWIILKVNTKGLDLFKDPRSIREQGVYCLDKINPERLHLLKTLDYDIIRSQSNFKKFINWYKWNKEKPEFVKQFIK